MCGMLFIIIGMLCCFGVFSGMSLGPLLDVVIAIDPRYDEMIFITLVYQTCIVIISVLISSYGAPLAQRASYLAQYSSLFGPDGAVNYDYIVTNSIKSSLIGSRCIPNGAHTNHC